MQLETKALETRDASSREIKEAFGEFLNAFESFKEANDERLAQIEKRSADAVTEEKVERINKALETQKRALDELMLSAARPALGGESKTANDRIARERKAAFDSYVRKGDASGFHSLEVKAMSVGSNPDGGYVVPLEIAETIDRILAKVSPIRALATVRQIGGNVYRKPISTNDPGTGWVAETDARPQTSTPNLSALDFPAMELYAMPAATQTLLDDAQVDIEQWLADEVQIVFAEQEGAAFINGNGTTQPKGILSYTNVADGSWTWGNIGYIASGAAGAFAGSNPSDQLLDLAYAPKQAYRANATWVMNRKVEAAIRKFKDTQGNYIWAPGLAAGQPATLFGFPVAVAEDMPDIAANSYSIAFGDFARGYLVVDRVGIRVLRDPYSAKPYVLFYTTKRVGGGVQNFEAIKLMKFAVS
ncbi:MAG: phage major capsid protein [Alphaproteobacteria bacterium]|nr:phage major capsid protein [Alphaproteobacteria bacterium]